MRLLDPVDSDRQVSRGRTKRALDPTARAPLQARTEAAIELKAATVHSDAVRPSRVRYARIRWMTEKRRLVLGIGCSKAYVFAIRIKLALSIRNTYSSGNWALKSLRVRDPKKAFILHNFAYL